MYFYHAHAIALGGRLDASLNPITVPNGSCALAVTGGSSSAEAPAFNSDGISFQSATLQVSGEEQSTGGLSVHVTKASAVINNLNIRNMITADRIEATVTSGYRDSDYDPTTVVEGSINGLKIDGMPVGLDISDDVSHHYPTFSSMKADFGNSSTRDRVLACLVGREMLQGDATTTDLKAAYDAYQWQQASDSLKPLVVCSLVDKINPTCGGTKQWGPIIMVPNFGTLCLCEVLVWPWMRCLTMFRVHFAGDSSSVSGGIVGANGGGFPPGATWP
jgi:hypothetical protein